MHLSPHWGPKEPSGVLSSLYVYLSGSLPGRPCHFLVIICTARNCVQRMQPQSTVLNPLSGSIIFPFVRLFIRGNFVVIVFLLISSVGSSVAIHLSQH